MDERRASLLGAVPLRPSAMSVDLRSDLMSGCMPSVADAMARAALRRPAMMRGEDPDERALTEEVAAMLGQEAALFVPTCTMANQIALRLWCPPGSAVLAERSAHVVTVECGATASTGAAVRTVSGYKGHLTPDAVEDALRGDGQCPSLVWFENTSMRAGGTIMPDGWQDGVARTLRGTRTKLHLDGSRLWNAAVGSGRGMAELAGGADTVAISLNKAVGAPLGSILTGARETIIRAAEMREEMGGNWRPVGILAAGARAALKGCMDRIAWAHEAAAHLASCLQASLGPRVGTPETNIILISCAGKARMVVASLHAAGVLGLALDADTIRLVAHSGMASVDLRALAETISGVLKT